MTLVELSLYVEGYTQRQKKQMESNTSMAWLIAKLNKAKRLPSLKRLLTFSGKAKILSKEEAEKEKKRHEELAARLAPDATGTEEDLLAFIKRQTKEWAEKIRSKAESTSSSEDTN